MEPFEWLLLAAGLAVGSVLGAKSNRVKKSAARGYLVVEEKAKELSSGVQKVRSRIEEARHKAGRNGTARPAGPAPRKAGASRSQTTKKARSKTTPRAATRHAA